MIAPLFAALALAAGLGAQDLVSSRDSLGALNGMAVEVDVDDGSGAAALDRRGLAIRIEGALRAANVHVYRYAGSRPTNPPGTPGGEGQLRLEVVAIRGATGADPQAVLRYDVIVAQWTRLDADPTAIAFARTWTQGGVVAAPASQAPTLLRRALDEALERHCRDYTAARAYWLARQRMQAAGDPAAR